jgi:hypothetical protein
MKRLTWKQKVEIADEVLRTYRNFNHLSRTESKRVWKLRRELDEMVVCDKCHQPMRIVSAGSALGTDWELYRCTKKHEYVKDATDPTKGMCATCNIPLPVIDADYNGPKYGQCHKCFGEVADVWNPAPDVHIH